MGALMSVPVPMLATAPASNDVDRIGCYIIMRDDLLPNTERLPKLLDEPVTPLVGVLVERIHELDGKPRFDGVLGFHGSL